MLSLSKHRTMNGGSAHFVRHFYSEVANLDDTFVATTLGDGGGIVPHKLLTSE